MPWQHACDASPLVNPNVLLEPMAAAERASWEECHVLRWWWFEPERMSPPVKTLLADQATSVWPSAATVWELSLKHHLGKLPELAQAISDPLDRMLAAQAELERLVPLSADPQPSPFPCEMRW